MDEDDMTPEQQAEYANMLKEYYPQADPKHNVHTFLNEVLKTKDTTKVGFLTEEELGNLKHSARTLKELELISGVICDNPMLSEYFRLEAENLAFAPSLSRNAKLITLAVTQKRTLADETKPRKPSSSWFKPKPKEEAE